MRRTLHSHLRSRLNAKINRNFEVFTATDFLAAITQHIPDKGAQVARYYGWYSNKMRGVRHRGLAAGCSRVGQGRTGFAAAHCEKLGKTCRLPTSAKSGRVGPQ